MLAHQPQPVRDFLLRSAVLDRLTGPLCDAVLARDDAGAMLQTLERANLFLVALDDRREWYRYHQLFADVLRARLLGEQPELVPVLHERASRWYEQHDLADEAVQHALAARDVDRAARLVEQAVPMIRRQRREAVVQGWLAALPDDTVRRSPVLSVFAAALLMVAGDLAAVEPRLDDAEAALAAADGGRHPAVARDRGAAHPAVDDRHVPGVPGAGPRRRRGHGASTPGAPSTSPAPTTTSPAAARPGSWASPPGPAAT